MISSEAVKAEESRIQKAYARRNDGALYSWFNAGQLFNVQMRERILLEQLRQCGCEDLQSKKLLEVGCGNGHWLREFVKWGASPANVNGVELLDDRVTEAKRLCPVEVQIMQGSAAKLEFADEAFDLVLQSMVFTSILDSALKQQIALEMMRVVKSEGIIFWYDYHVNNPWNSDVRGVKRREIFRLFPNCRIHLQRITLAPPLARVLAPYSYLLCYLLEKFPPLCTHYLGVIRKQ
jgi:ubiquinone/menaquinone biosynthesis C-methylase UbiE